jgi:DEAD/DEAH box helicase domain-containing protein
MSPAAVKKLIETRSNRFISAVNEWVYSCRVWSAVLNYFCCTRLISATPEGEDPVRLLIEAGHNYVPVDHPIPKEDIPTNPNLNQRPSISNVISDLTNSLWYVDQIAHRRTVDAKEAQICR